MVPCLVSFAQIFVIFDKKIVGKFRKNFSVNFTWFLIWFLCPKFL